VWRGTEETELSQQSVLQVCQLSQQSVSRVYPMRQSVLPVRSTQQSVARVHLTHFSCCYVFLRVVLAALPLGNSV
jgi:hypothetical protein